MKKLIKNNLVLFIFLLGLGLRFYNLNKLPPALFSDEVDLSYQAYSFLKTGKDYFGNFLPVHFHSFADWRTPLYLYSAVPTIAIFGLNEWGVRLPAAIYGSLTILTLYLLVFKLSRQRDLALVSVLLIAITPWHIHYSRAGFEVTAMLFFLTLGFWLFFKELEEKEGFFLSAVVLGLCLYTYAPVKLFLPILLAIVVFWKRKEINKTEIKKKLFSLIIFLLVVFPVAKSTLFGQGNFRFNYLNIFSSNEVASQVNQQRLIDTSLGKTVVPGMKPPLLAYIFHNKPLSWFFTFIDNYLSAFSPTFLFSKGDVNPRHSLPNFGLILLVLAPFCLWGLAEAISEFKTDNFWLGWLFLSPVAASLTTDGANHASRLSFLMMPLIYFASKGLILSAGKFRLVRQKKIFLSIFFILLILNFTYYLHLYYSHYSQESEKYWHYGFKQAMMEIKKIGGQYPKIYFSSSFEQPLIFFLFWTQYPPEGFNANLLKDIEDGGFKGKVLAEKYYFGQLKSFQPSTGKSLLLVTRNELGGDLEKDESFKKKIFKKFYSYNGEPRFYLIKND